MKKLAMHIAIENNSVADYVESNLEWWANMSTAPYRAFEHQLLAWFHGHTVNPREDLDSEHTIPFLAACIKEMRSGNYWTRYNEVKL
jgi:hypothetical protein